MNEIKDQYLRIMAPIIAALNAGDVPQVVMLDRSYELLAKIVVTDDLSERKVNRARRMFLQSRELLATVITGLVVDRRKLWAVVETYPRPGVVETFTLVSNVLQPTWVDTEDPEAIEAISAAGEIWQLDT